MKKGLYWLLSFRHALKVLQGRYCAYLGVASWVLSLPGRITTDALLLKDVTAIFARSSVSAPTDRVCESPLPVAGHPCSPRCFTMRSWQALIFVHAMMIGDQRRRLKGICEMEAMLRGFRTEVTH